MGKLFWAKAVMLIAFLVLFSHVASAGCCVADQTCSLSDGTGCAVEDYNPGDCGAIAECQIGCCCSENRADRSIACADPFDFEVNSELSINSPCSCASQLTFRISGKVRRDGNPEGGVVVSAGTISTTSDNSANVGYYQLDNVPAGNVVLSASSAGCTGSAQVFLDYSDAINVDIPLTCACTPGCYPSTNGYCDNLRVMHGYNLAVPAEKVEYCLYCNATDPVDCGGTSECRPGDGACPLGCTATVGDPKYDSDCVCNIAAKNGYCPPSCDKDSDADCSEIISAACGDGFIFYPFETCEPGMPPPASSCTADKCSKTCNCYSNSTCNNGILDAGEQCERGNICADGTDCLACKCGLTCAGANRNPTLTATLNSTVKGVMLRWALTDACSSIISSFRVKYCAKVDGIDDCNEFGVEPTTFSVPMSGLMENVQYTFQVFADYRSGDPGFSRIVSLRTGSDYCMNRPADAPAEFCLDNKRSKCTTSSTIQTIQDCNAGGKFCNGPNAFGNTTCEASDGCGLCNGLFGSFGRYLDLRVLVDDKSFYCNYASGRDVVAGCYFDRTKYLFKAYQSCGNVRSCYDFKSKDSCTDSADPCKLNKNCEWVDLESNPALGGVCRPKNPQLQDCTLCDDPDYNWITPRCLPDVCSLFGTCYYQGTNNTPSCAGRTIVNCKNYNSEDECVGFGTVKKEVSVDAQYDPLNNYTRFGGTNAVIRSGDKLGLGKCYWTTADSRCRRDADGFRGDGGTLTGYDCADADYFCESDFIEPKTSVIVKQGFYPANPKIMFTVKDNYPSDKLASRFCIVPSGQNCYPQEASLSGASGSYFQSSNVNNSGTYSLFYYSEDPAKNLEPVSKVNLIIDADPPMLDILSPTADESYVNTPNVTIFGRTSNDTSYVCVNNTQLRKTVCINNCAKPGALPPCIDADGFFTVTVPISATSSSASQKSIVVTAVDYAGNNFQNTIYGIIYDITPPRSPTILISISN